MNFKKSFSIFFTIFTLGCSSIFSLGNNLINIDLSPDVGIIHGNISEYVYSPAVHNTDNLLSRLDWELAAIPYLGAEENITILNYISITLSEKIGIPCKAGSMQDYDWLNSISSLYINDDPTELTNYSKHTNTLNSYLLFSASLGGIIPLFDMIYINPLIAYEYNFIKFTGSDGYKKYKSDNFINIPFTGNVITYSQEANIFKLGIKLTIKPNDSLYIGTSFYYSPQMAFINALDCHLLRKTAFWDKLENSNLYQADLRIGYKFNKNNSLGLKCSFDYLPLCTGSDFSKTLDKNNNPNKYTVWKKENELGGTSHYLWTWSVLYTFSF